MLRTMAVIVAAVGILLLLVPAPPAVVQPGPDPVAAAAAVTDEVGFAPAVVAPTDLGEGWATSYARVETVEGVVQWRLGYLSPTQRRVDVEQAREATVDWLTRQRSAPRIGAQPAILDEVLPGLGTAALVSVAGMKWWQYERGDGTVALARESGETLLVVSVAAQRPSDELQQVAAALDDAAAAN